MGCDMHGFVEVKDGACWKAKIDVGKDVGRNYDIFGLLFGVRNVVRFKPVAPDRDIPRDASDEYLTLYGRWVADAHSMSWITLQEIEAIDWDKPNADLDGRIREYVDGKMMVKFGSRGGLDEEQLAALERGDEIKSTHTFSGKPSILKMEKATPREVLSKDWQTLIERMRQLAEKAGGSDCVRLVVFFDN